MGSKAYKYGKTRRRIVEPDGPKQHRMKKDREKQERQRKSERHGE